MNSVQPNTTSVNVATNTPVIIARKRAMEGALIVLIAGAFVDGLEAAVQIATCHPGTPCTYDWALIINTGVTALLGALARGVTAYMAANANVVVNAADAQPVPAPSGTAAAAVPQPPAPPAGRIS